MSVLSCLRCGERPDTDRAADLVEVDELCPGCRAADLSERIRFVRAEIADLTRDVEPAASRGLLPDQLILEIAELITGRTPA